MQPKETDFVIADFSVRVQGGSLVETTRAQEAKDAGIFKDDVTYRPSLVMLPDMNLMKGFKAALLGAAVDEEKTVSIGKEDGFGERDESLVRIIPLSKFKESGMNPEQGMLVTIDNYNGRVQSISSGRVRVDFNHDLAGKNLEYKFKILSVLGDAPGKLSGILDEFLEAGKAAKMSSGVAEVVIGPEVVSKNRDYLSKKVMAIESILLYIPEVTKLLWTEEFVPKR